MRETEQILKELLKIGAIKISTKDNPFTVTFASGIESPMYFDNRLSLSFDHIRRMITNAYVEKIMCNFPHVQAIAGVATGAISQGTLIADRLGLPFMYVRSEAKEHGTKKLIEGNIVKHQRVVVIEDLISTGSSSMNAVETLRDEGIEVLGVVATFSYQFALSNSKFHNAKCKLLPLMFLDNLLPILTPDEVETLIKWITDQKT
jgi:orotate phosphoribosyltransferase